MPVSLRNKEKFRDWFALTPFERVLADPCPLASGPRACEFIWEGDSVSIEHLFEAANATLAAWKHCESLALKEFLLVSPAEFVLPIKPRERNNQTQVESLLEDWSENVEHRAEAYDLWRDDLLDEPYPEDSVLPDGVEDRMTELEFELMDSATNDLFAVLDGGTPELHYHRGAILEQLQFHREEWKRKFDEWYASDFSDGRLEDFVSEIQQRWLRLAVGGRLIERWDDPLHVLAYRWEYDWIGTANWIREAALAGIRLWCDRLCMLGATARDKFDFLAIEQLAKLLLPELRHAFVAEAPSTHLGQSEAALVVATFPLFVDLPAETRIPDDVLHAKWKGMSEVERQEFENNFDEYSRYRRWSAWKGYGSLGFSPVGYQPEIVRRALAVRFASRVVEEAARFGRDGFANPVTLKDEAEALLFVQEVVSDVMAFGKSKPSPPVNRVQSFESLCIPPVRAQDRTECEGDESADAKQENFDSNSTDETLASRLASAPKKESSGNSKPWHPAFKSVADDYLKACLKHRKHLELKTWLGSKTEKYFRKAGFALTTTYAAFSANRAAWWPQLEKELTEAGITICERTRQRTGKKNPTRRK